MELNSKQKIIVALKLLIPLLIVTLLFLSGISAGVITFGPEKEGTGGATAILKIDFGNNNIYSKKIDLINATVFDFLLESEKNGDIKIETTYWESFDSYVVDSITYQNEKYASDTNHYWAFYINGEAGIKGADKIYVENDDLIEWRFVEF